MPPHFIKREIPESWIQISLVQSSPRDKSDLWTRKTSGQAGTEHVDMGRVGHVALNMWTREQVDMVYWTCGHVVLTMWTCDTEHMEM